MAEGARLESVYTATYRGFESPPHRHILRRARTQVRAFFSHVAPAGGMRTPDRGSTTGAASWTDRARSKRAAPPKTPGAFLNNACVGPAGARPRDGPSKGERSESIPPSPPYFKKSSYASTGFFFRMWHPPGGMRTPDRGSTTGNASWTDREPASGLPRRGERSESIPPSPPYFKKSSYASTGFFSHVAPAGGMRIPDRGSTTGNASWTDRARSKRAAPTKTPGAFLNNACVGPAGARPRDGPSNGERSESIPPSPPYFKKSSYASTGFFFACGTRRGG